MKAKFLTIAAVNAALLTLGSSAWAQITYDQDVNTGAGQEGTYYGTGNNNGNWAVSTSDNIQLGLRGKVYGQNIYPDNGDGVYVVNAGVSPLNPARDSWNFDFSINVNASGAGSANLGNFTYKLLVDSDPSAADNFTTINPVTTYPDNEFVSAGTPGKTVSSAANPANPSDFNEVQNSENAAFGLPVGYDPTIDGTYDIELEVLNSDNRVVAEDEITIDVVGAPEVSSTLPLLAVGVFGLAFANRKLKAKTA